MHFQQVHSLSVALKNCMHLQYILEDIPEYFQGMQRPTADLWCVQSYGDFEEE